tara:strand:+ start:114 stop:1604 length:1491 start_codon:yes stop_codon:yes gene_type:complete
MAQRRKSDVGDWADLFDSLHQAYTDVRRLNVERQLEELKYNAQLKENALSRQHEKNMQDDKQKHESLLLGQKSDKEKQQYLYETVMKPENARYLKYNDKGEVDVDLTFQNMQNISKLQNTGSNYSNLSFLKAGSHYGMSTIDPTPGAITNEDIQLLDSYMQDTYFYPYDDTQYERSNENDQYLQKLGILYPGEAYSGNDGVSGIAVKDQNGNELMAVGRTDMITRFNEYKKGLIQNPMYRDAQKYQDLVKGGLAIDTTIGANLFKTEYMVEQEAILQNVPNAIRLSSGYFMEETKDGKTSYPFSDLGEDWYEKNLEAYEDGKPTDVIYQLYHTGNMESLLDRYIDLGNPENHMKLQAEFKKTYLEPTLRLSEEVYHAVSGAYFARQTILKEQALQQSYMDNITNEKHRKSAIDTNIGAMRALGGQYRKVRENLRKTYSYMEEKHGKDWHKNDEALKEYIVIQNKLGDSFLSGKGGKLSSESIADLFSEEFQRYKGN